MDIKKELQEKDFKFKHKFGQNFITDTNLLSAIVKDAQIKKDDAVLEIGPGAGTLTKEILSATQAKVIAVEIDKDLESILQKNVGKYPNFELIFGDILKISPKELKEKFAEKPFKVVANLPYYISTPILFYLLENDFNVESITVMLQLELAKRLTAQKNTKDYGALTILLDYLGNVTLTRKVPRVLFTPAPNVDSAIVRIEINKNKFSIRYSEIAPFVKKSFAMRRKTLENNIVSGFGLTREEVSKAIEKCGFLKNCRAEDLTSTDFIKLYQTIFKTDKKE